ncbi:hypothetical protein CISG_02224 [Coccidioides immitis RMSCC 3703]|uniref:Uncharacterized protein n=1 Tax=Coccidioides immitis RMSCC 3703 TaxID=454286 RepID=A0A0J8R9A9_COCIT|nr:hypothetical protein CISG_02224 [Coccidioides immitis RMSCC 3703]
MPGWSPLAALRHSKLGSDLLTTSCIANRFSHDPVCLFPSKAHLRPSTPRGRYCNEDEGYQKLHAAQHGLKSKITAAAECAARKSAIFFGTIFEPAKLPDSSLLIGLGTDCYLIGHWTCQSV